MSEVRTTPIDALVRYVNALEFEDLPETAVRLVERCFLDTVGVTIAGAAEGSGLTAAETVAALGGGDRGPSTIIGHDWRGTPVEAAFVNATAGHGLDFDDVAEPMSNHPSVTMVAPLLAVGDHVDASGTDLVTAFAAGFETQYVLAAPIMPAHYEVGWHSTATLGTFGAAAAVANLLNLSVDRTHRTLSIAASLPAGLKRNFGTDTKPMHAGAAARSGVTAAMLAAADFSADTEAITGERGFFDLYTRPEGFDLSAMPTAGDDPGLLAAGVHVKKYPCCYFTHASIAAAQDLRERHNIESDDVESVTVSASQGAHDALSHVDPDTGLEGKFSMHYTVASALTRERVGLAAFDDGNVDDSDVQAVRSRVTFELDEHLPYAAHDGQVRIETYAGSTYERHRESPPGTADNPLSNAELREKFLMCASRGLNEDRAISAYKRCDDLRDLDRVAELTKLL